MIEATSHRLLLVALYFGGVSALAGGVLGVAANGAGVPTSYLFGTPFTSYLVPGLILGIVIGGTQAVAAILTQRRHPLSALAASIAGFAMIVWIFVELAVIGEYSFLQTIYFALGVIELGLVMLGLGLLRARRRASEG